MAFTSTGVIEIRASGASDNGAYYDPAGAGATNDYSQSDTPIANGADGDCNNSTTFTASSNPFTAAMKWNGIHISGTGYTTGFYVITVVNAANSVTLDRNPTTGGHPTTGSYKVGGACTTLEAPLSSTLVAGNTVHIKAGNYSWGTLTTSNGSGAAPIVVTGYKTNRNDNPMGSNRPLITLSGSFVTGTFNVVKNLEFTANFNGTVLNMTAATGYGKAINVKATQIFNAAVIAISLGTTDIAMGCEGASTHGYGIAVGAMAVACYAHDSSVAGFLGAGAAGDGVVLAHCVTDTCGKGVDDNGGDRWTLINCVCYNNTEGLHTTSPGANAINTIFRSNTTGWNAATNGATTYSANNVWSNTTDISGTGLVKGPFDVTSNPNMVDPANGDFRLQAGSPAIGVALQQSVNTGVVGVYNNNIGVFQNGAGVAQVLFVGS